jgi:uncharacterized protein (TIGR02186 family)
MRRHACIALLALLASAAEAAPDRAKETVEAGASTRQVAITSSFTGTEILVFGAVEQSVQPSPEAGTYDIVVVVEGTSAPVIVRKKSEVGGLWVNTSSLRFASLPSYYAIASTRPIDKFASREVLDENGIGFEHVRIIPAGSVHAQTKEPVDLSDFKKALIRLKQEQRLYVRSDYGVTFIGRSLFRATIELPPNVPIGPLVARVYLFKDGLLLSHYESHVMLERQGIERYIHDSAMERPLLYGIATVLIAAAAGLIAAFAFRRLA